ARSRIAPATSVLRVCYRRRGVSRVARLRTSLACALAGLLGCGGGPAIRETQERTTGAERAGVPALRAPALLAEPWAAWTGNPAYADVDLPFVMGITQRPCDAEYS